MDLRSYAQQEKRFLIFLFAVSLFLRMALFGWYMRHDQHYMLAFDSEQYHNIAVQVAQGKGIVTKEGTPNFYRLPGYPVFLGMCYKLFNNNTPSLRVKLRWARQVALLTQLLLASLIPIFIFFFALTLFPGNLLVAKVAAVAAALHAGFIIYAGILSTESLFLFFFLLFLICFFSKNPRLFYAGIFLGIASLIRPVGHYLLVVATLLLLMAGRERAWRAVALCGGGWLVVVTPWLLRNYMLAGALFFHTLPGLHFLQYSAAAVEQARLGCDYFHARDNVFALWDSAVAIKELELGRPVTEFERFAIAEKVAFRHLLTHPLFSLKHACIQIARTMGTLYSSILLYVPAGTIYGADASLWFKIKLYLFPRAMDPWLIPLIYWEMISYLLTLLGCLLFCLQALYQKIQRRTLLKTVPFMSLLVIITLAYGCARLRFAVEPFMIVLAAYAWVRVYSRA